VVKTVCGIPLKTLYETFIGRLLIVITLISNEDQCIDANDTQLTTWSWGMGLIHDDVEKSK